MSIRHIVFDCDGVLVDSEPLSMKVDVDILAEGGIAMSPDEAHRRFVGKTFAAMIAEVEREFGVRFPPGVSADKDRRLLALYAQALQPVPGVAAALDAIARPCSVASNSPRLRVAAALRIAGLASWFADRIVTFEDVAEGKPAPDVFLEAARRAAAPPESCLVIEDSVTGVTAAARAGCHVLGFTGTHPDASSHRRQLQAAGAAHVFHHMAELPPLVLPRLSTRDRREPGTWR